MLHMLALFGLCWWRLIGVFGESVSAIEGESVTLHTDVNEIKKDDDILWKFGSENSLIAKLSLEKQIFSTYDVHDGRFSDKLKMDHQTGSLTITDIRSEHAGVYKLLISGAKRSSKTFSVSVSARLPVPVIFRNSSQCSSYCSVVCSVVNVSAVSLSWYKESILSSSISVSDLSISLSLPLEVEYQENNTYSCVVKNSISSHTTHLDISTLCQPCEGTAEEAQIIHSCDSTEVVIRLVFSALVGVAIVVVLFYDVSSARD